MGHALVGITGNTSMAQNYCFKRIQQCLQALDMIVPKEALGTATCHRVYIHFLQSTAKISSTSFVSFDKFF